MRLSRYYAPTLKEDPADAEVVSHKLMLRAGMIRKLAGGIYSYLPLGWRVHQKTAQIVREEMDAIGAQEFYLPGEAPRITVFTAAYEVTALEPRIARYERLAEMRRADRCITCHLGMEDTDISNPYKENPFKSHPKIEFIRQHPIQKKKVIDIERNFFQSLLPIACRIDIVPL